MLLKCCTQICQQIWKTQQWPQDWKMSVFIPIPKKSSAKECSNYHTIVLISHTSKVMLKILQSRLQRYVNWELSDVQAGFRKDRGTRDCQHSLDHRESKGILEKYLLLLHWLCQNLWLCGSQQTGKFFQRWEYKITLRNMYVGQEVTVRTLHRTTDWFKIGKGVWQGCILSPCLFNLHAEYIMWNAGLNTSQAGVKTARGNINNFRRTDNITLTAESEEELKSILMRVKEESERAGWKLNI